jgi:alkylation response protein AidB-like acyl-CoA dehydrogenase
MIDERAPAPEELADRAAALVPLLRRNAVEADRLRRVPDENIQALDEAGVFMMARPPGRGGHGADPTTIARVMTSIASGCPATAWVVTIINSVAYLAELLPEAALQEIYATPRVRIAAVFGRSGAVLDPVQGGYRVRGQGLWPFNSGCHHAHWDLLRVTLAEPDGTMTPAFAGVPMAELTIEDDWNVMGAVGTGSNSVSCQALFVPAHRVAPIRQSAQSLVDPTLSMATGVALPLGMTRYAIESFLEIANAHGVAHLGYERMVDAPIVQAAYATAAVKAKLMEAFQHWTLLGTDEDAAVLQATSTACMRLAREAIEALYEVCPSSELKTDRPLQRLLRDVHAFEHQHALTPFICNELYGRTLGTPR